MVIAYIIAGAILGFLSTDFIAMIARGRNTSNLVAKILLAFVGGVGGHLVHTLLFN